MHEIKASSYKQFDASIIIDARSPNEFDYSHIPNAKNYFALNNEEHKEVGTIYKQKSKQHAKILGASYICKNTSKHLLDIEKKLKSGSKILIYCAKGGLRSKSLGLILEQVGFRVARIDGGYKAYRNYVLDTLEEFPKIEFITLFGNTGSGKTQLLQYLKPSIDLEGLANHQGSTFGLIHGKQPSMKTFENNLSYEMLKIQNEKFCFIEGESRRIGQISLPKKLHEQMKKGVNIKIISPMKDRVKRILKDYEHISSEYFFECMDKIKRYIKKSVFDEVILRYKEQKLDEVAFLLLENYYDMVYKKPNRIDYEVEFTNLQSTLERLNEIAKENFNAKIL